MKPLAPPIAIVGLACIYPDARTPVELWENVLAQRRAFRRLPPERLCEGDYFSTDPAAPDRTNCWQAAVIEGYEFDRVSFRVAGSTFRSADLTHWLALDVAANALADAGFAEGRGLPRETTGVVLGNTLTGELSRANVLRHRWPYVRRRIEVALQRENWSAEDRRGFLDRLETEYKSPFPPVGEESLAGGLSNTIAGRICNQFDLKGGGFTVDGACASSLLAVANACSALAAGDLDVALAGGVDLSLDPFELVGFAKTGALAADEMRVFDRRSAGFWPGEGCGFVVLMRHDDALAQGCRVYATIRGWGVSSDGSGGLTRPEAHGQLAALRRAYRRAGFGADTVAYCEGHGTGTAVGDATELEVLSHARREANPEALSAVLGSIKANIGHTKSAAGIAGLIKATMAVHTQVLPPTTACEQPQDTLTAGGSPLRILREAEVWPEGQPLRASVSAMGFGGINAHVVVEGLDGPRRQSLSAREQSFSDSAQDAELFLFSAETEKALAPQIEGLRTRAAGLSFSELADLAAALHSQLTVGPVRAAIVASRPQQLAARLETLQTWLSEGVGRAARFAEGVYLGARRTPPRIAFLFPGQGSPSCLRGGLWARRFEFIRKLYQCANFDTEGDAVSTRVAQPAVVTASLAALAVLKRIGLGAQAAIGHSLGEITALHWAGAMDAEALLRIVLVRGEAMAELGDSGGAMAAIAAPATAVQAEMNGDPLAIVGFNSPRQTVVAGAADAVLGLVRRTRAAGWSSSLLPVSHAFHTPMVAAAVPVLDRQLAVETFAPLVQAVFSTVTGAPLAADVDLRALLCRQVTSPVRFDRALASLLGARPATDSAGETHALDLLIEVGPGAVLAGLARESTAVPVIALEACGESLAGLLQAAGMAFALGAPLQLAALFAGRFTRQFDFKREPKFFGNPCESAPLSEPALVPARASTAATGSGAGTASAAAPAADVVPLELVRQLVARRAELPPASVQDHHRMLSDLHLNSITVGQLVSEAAKTLGLSRLVSLTDFANASVAELGEALEELKRTGGTMRPDDPRRQPPGVDTWIERFRVELVEQKRPPFPVQRPNESVLANQWQVLAPEAHLLANQVKEKLSQLGGRGVVLCLPESPHEDHLGLFLAAARAVGAMEGPRRFVLVQHGWGGSGFARTLHLETPALSTCVVNVPLHDSRSSDWIAVEAVVADGFTEVHYDAAGRRSEPRLAWLPVSPADSESAEYPIGPEDVLLVTGGGKGIAAECALALGRESGARLALMGRSNPDEDSALRENLARFTAAGVNFCYAEADVTDAAAVRAAVADIEGKLGQITAFLHGAGANAPQLIAALEETDLRRTLAPKLDGARNVLAALNPDRLRMLLTFGSVIARAGMRGEGDYALANEWLRAFTEEFQSRHPRCQCLALEWSVWSGVGMGERLGRMDALIAQGITPIPVDQGVRLLLELLRSGARPSPGAASREIGESEVFSRVCGQSNVAAPEDGRAPVAQVICGRFGDVPTLKLETPELPLRRFLERPRVYYPGVELIVEAELSAVSDPYLEEHVFHQQRLLPAVVGLEAMAQVAMALTGAVVPPDFENVQLRRPVVISDKGASTIRLAALRQGEGVVEVCLRAEETDFQVDHFRATCRFATTKSDGAPLARGVNGSPAAQVPLDPRRDLYGPILFHEGRFQRVGGYRLLKAKECVAEIHSTKEASWFGPYLAGDLVLGDPAARDAALHAIQACVPHRRILPAGIDRVAIHSLDPGPRSVHAWQRRREDNDFVYDLEITNADHQVIERWEGLRLRAVEELPPYLTWPHPLLAACLERRLEEFGAASSFTVALERQGKTDRSSSGDAAMQMALGESVRILRRPDGKPDAVHGRQFSAAHAEGFTLAVAGTGPVACDLEPVSARSVEVWRDLLGRERANLAERIARECSESFDTSATRLWTMIECLKKSGSSIEAAIRLEAMTDDGWVLLNSGALTVATCVATVRGAETPLAMGLAYSMAETMTRRPAAVGSA